MKLNSKILSGWLLGLLMLTIVKVAWAVNLTLTKIGTLSTVGVDYSTVNYTGGIPRFEGTASPAAQVSIRIKTSTDATTAASPSGVWNFTPGVLDAGSNAIVITSGSETLSLTLIYNATPAATPTPTPLPEELPAAGIWEYYLPAFGAGFLVLFLGRYIKNKMLAWEGKKKI